ncbi:MAG: helix-turn-helix domain-containing protein [Rikenellaceae bacterium]
MDMLPSYNTADLDNSIARFSESQQQFEKFHKDYRPLLNGEYFLTDRELSERLHVSRRTLHNWRADGILDYIELGGKIIYKESTIQKLLDKNYVKGWQ